jgi:hypothetical protein
MSIAEQIALALRQQLQVGGHNLSERVTYEPLNNAVQTGISAIVKRGEGKAEAVMGADYDQFEADILLYAADLLLPPRRGDRVRTATEVWHIDGIRAELSGGYLLRATRKVLKPAVTEQ